MGRTVVLKVLREGRPLDLRLTVDETFPGGLFNGKTAEFWGHLENTNFASYRARCNTRVLAVHGESDDVS